MELLSGEFKVTLYEKGRISLPAHLRKILNDEKLIITQQIEDKCLLLYTANEYTIRLKEIQNSTNTLNRDDRLVRRQYFNYLPIEIDKAGRIPIPQRYRDFAGLSKDCVVIGVGENIEIWAEDRCNQSQESSVEDTVAAFEKLGNTIKNRNTQ